MSDGINLIDIIFFAALAAFLVLRLHNVLGRRTGNERPPSAWTKAEVKSDAPEKGPDKTPDTNNVIDLASLRKTPSEQRRPSPIFVGPGAEGLAVIYEADPNFTVEGFVSGARAAFQMIVAAYAAGDTKVLRPLLSDEVYRNFAAAIEGRAHAGEHLQSEIIRIRLAEVTEASMEGGEARVTIRFESEQINVVRDTQDSIVDGDPDQVTQVIDEWTFRRFVPSANPNWELVATHSPEA